MIISSDSLDCTFEAREILIRRDAREEGIAACVSSMYRQGESIERIAQLLSIPVDTVKAAIKTEDF